MQARHWHVKSGVLFQLERTFKNVGIACSGRFLAELSRRFGKKIIYVFRRDGNTSAYLSACVCVCVRAYTAVRLYNSSHYMNGEQNLLLAISHCYYRENLKKLQQAHTRKCKWNWRTTTAFMWDHHTHAQTETTYCILLDTPWYVFTTTKQPGKLKKKKTFDGKEKIFNGANTIFRGRFPI